MDEHYPSECYLPQYVNRELFYEAQQYELCRGLKAIRLYRSNSFKCLSLCLEGFMFPVMSKSDDMEDFVDTYEKAVCVSKSVYEEVSSDEFKDELSNVVV